MNKKELRKAIIELPVDCSGLRPKIDQLTTLELIKLLDELEKVKVPQFVADWIANVKRNGFKFRNSSRFHEEIVSSNDVYRVMYYILKESIAGEAIRIWVNANRDAFARAWIEGYEVDKEPKYTVKVKSTKCSTTSLVFSKLTGEWFFSVVIYQGVRFKHTRKELEEAGFGWVFDCEGIEVEEVE